jgi:hypothetical protein
VHLGQDTRLNYDQTMLHVADAERERIDGSEGLTLNLTIDARYRLNDRWALELSAGVPMVTRAVRPDGLTRSMVLNTGLAYRFGR